MRIAIYGAGNYGKYIYHEIINHEHSKISIAFWIDNYVEAKEVYDLPVYTEKEFWDLCKSDEIDAIVVGIEKAKIVQDITLSLLLKGFDKIYIPTVDGFRVKVPILNSEGNFGPCVRFYKDVRPSIGFMEILIINRCNLNCKSCGHFSNLATGSECLDLGRCEEYLEQLSKKVKSIDRFQILGGEPLLNPQLPLYVKLVRKYFPVTHIDVVTNGLRLLSISQEVIDTMVQCDAFFFISQYRPTRERLGEIIEFLDKNRINYYISHPIVLFEKELTFKEQDGEKAYKERAKDGCICHGIRDGRIYLCPVISLLYDVQNYFDIHISEEELKESSIDLMSDDVDGWDMLKYFSRPTPVCRYCNPKREEIPWETGEPRREDWISDC